MPSQLQRIVRQTTFAEEERMRPALRYWLSRPPAERVAAVEYLRTQIDGVGRLRALRYGEAGSDFDEFIASLTAHGVEFVVVPDCCSRGIDDAAARAAVGSRPPKNSSNRCEAVNRDRTWADAAARFLVLHSFSWTKSRTSR